MGSFFLKLYIYSLLIVSTIEWLPQAMSRAITNPDVSMREMHDQWMAQFGREYKDTAEREKRYKLFKANVEYINSINGAGNKPYKLGVNKFADLTHDEFKAAHIGYRSISKTEATSTTSSIKSEKVSAIPRSVDWRKSGAVTPIRDGFCGAWTFPAVDTVEGLVKIKTGKLFELSVQEIVDCDQGGHGCDGGFTDEAFEFIKEHGLTTASNYPSNGSQGTCDTKKEAEPVAKISGYEHVPLDNETALTQAVGNQPVAVTVDASGVDFQFYASGVFTGECGTDIDHGVTLVGYGTSNGKLKYWLIKNSWGTGWGEDGYMRMLRDVQAKEGMCGIAISATYPTL